MQTKRRARKKLEKVLDECRVVNIIAALVDLFIMGVGVDKRDRQTTLLRLVRHHSAATQGELVGLLKKSGFIANQAGISRDLRELGVIKVDGHYQPVGALRAARGPAAADPLSELIISSEPVGANLIIVRTRTGAAATVGVEIDRRRFPEIAGTIAGDDTLFVAVKSRSAQGRTLAQLRAMKVTP